MLEDYKVSRASLREALRLLEVQGLITLKPGPGGGPVVGEVDAINLASTATLYFHLAGYTYGELFETQMLLEPLCAEKAALNGDPEEMREAFAPFLGTDHPMEGAPYYAKTHDFHLLVYRFAQVGILSLLTRSISHIVTTHVLATMDPVDRRPHVVSEHRELAQALIKGQPARAKRLMAEHYEGLVGYYRKRWPERFDELVEWR